MRLFQLCCLFFLGLLLTATPLLFDSWVSPAMSQTAPQMQSEQAVQEALLDSMKSVNGVPPGTALKIADQIQIQGDYAVAHWSWGEDAGGWALLQNQASNWVVLTRRSDAITPQAVSGFGVPADLAQTLVNAYDQQWQSYPSP